MEDDDEGLNMRNFGYYDTATKPHHHHHHHHHQIPLQLMPTMDFKPLLGGRDTSSSVMPSVNAGFPQRDCGVHASHYHMDYLRDWIARYSALPGNNYSYSAQTEGSRSHHHVQMMRQSDSSTDMQMVRADGLSAECSDGLEKKRSNGKPEMVPKAKKPKKAVNGAKESGGGGSVKRAKAPNKPLEVNINGINMDISTIPIPVCSCTGVARQCYRWGSGGWQSACCTTGMSMYPLPMSTKRRGARIAGRKMSLGAFKKVLEKLVPEGYDFSNPINLRTFWAKHGTNKFVTIR